MIYIISDWHFWHHNVIEFENRPFKDINHMNEQIIKRHNDAVKECDTVYFLGDAGFNKHGLRECLKQLKGSIIFVEGNHDKSSNGMKAHNAEIILRIGGIKVQLIHNPEYARVDYPLILCGHSHGMFLTKELHYCGRTSLIVNMSVENWNYTPVSWERIQKVYDIWKRSHEESKRRK